jgi:uncharacterized short protein YbdD (DUF466 family)
MRLRSERPPDWDSPLDWGSRLRQILAQARHAWLGVLGAPDYLAYCAHQRAHHPERPLMTESEYVRCFIERRYDKREGGGRCC